LLRVVLLTLSIFGTGCTNHTRISVQHAGHVLTYFGPGRKGVPIRIGHTAQIIGLARNPADHLFDATISPMGIAQFGLFGCLLLSHPPAADLRLRSNGDG